jgi:hypothetical protein
MDLAHHSKHLLILKSSIILVPTIGTRSAVTRVQYQPGAVVAALAEYRFLLQVLAPW